MSNIYISNSLTGKRELFKPIDDNDVRMFVCGPTVYGPMHIGHAKTYIAYDFMARVIKTLYPNFRYIQNITDVDNKIILRAQTEGKSVREVSEYWENNYYANMRELGNDQADGYYRAHDNISEIIDQINILLGNGLAYIINGDGVYINSKSIKDYDSFYDSSSDSIEYSRINNGGKLSVADFALWKFSSPDALIGWGAPFGYGRPGWHIEDTAISAKYFGHNYDIHGGAIDLIFPHHEAEIMIMKGVSGSSLANYWAHGGLLTVNGVKMGKSLDNFITVDDVLGDWSGRVIRFFVLSKNYSSNVDWSNEALHQAEKSIKRIKNYYHYAPDNLANDGELYHSIMGSLYDDFNSSEALGIIFRAITQKEISRYVLDRVNDLYASFDFKSDYVPDNIKQLAEERLNYRRNKNWELSDILRDKIISLGWIIRDEGDSYYVERI